MHLDLDDEEMMQLAAELSINDVIENLSRHWTDQDLSETSDTLKLLTEILENLKHEFEANPDDEPIPLEPVSPYLPKPVLPSHIRSDITQSTVRETHQVPASRSSYRKVDRSHSFNALVTVTSKLRHFQKKMLQHIQQMGPEDSMFITLLELNESVMAAITESENTISDMFPDHSAGNSLAPISKDGTYVEDLMYLSHERGGEMNSVENHISSLHSSFIEVKNILSRSATHSDVEVGILKLLHLFKTIHAATDASKLWKDMQRVGVLHALLCALPRCAECPDVKVLACRAIAVLVTFEDDWYLLRRGAYDIFSALLYLISIANSQAQISGESIINSNGELAFDSGAESSVVAAVDVAVHVASAQCVNSEDERRHKLCMLRDVRALVSAAFAKLTAVLSAEWTSDVDCFEDASNIPLGLNSNSFTVSSENLVTHSTLQFKSTESISSQVSDIVVDGPISSNNGAINQTVKVILEIISGLNFGSSAVLTLAQPQLVGAESSSHIGSESDEFGDKPILLQATPLDLPIECKIDATSVVLSIALCNLSEIPQYRSHLVTAGVVMMLKDWTLLGMEQSSLVGKIMDDYFSLNVSVMEIPTAKNEGIIPVANLILPDYESHDEICRASKSFPPLLTKSWTQLCELVNNTAATTMYLLGGAVDCRYRAPTFRNNDKPISADSSAKKRSAGNVASEPHLPISIDEQIMADGLLAAISSFVIASMRYDSRLANYLNRFENDVLSKQESSKDTNRSACTSLKFLREMIFPRAAGIHFAQAFCLLSTRPQNRTNLIAVDGATAISLLLANAVACRQREDENEYGPISLDNLSESYHSFLNSSLDSKVGVLGDRFGLDVIREQRHFRTKAQQDLMQEFAALVASDTIEASSKAANNDEEFMTQRMDWRLDMIDPTTYMLSVALACLDALTFFLVDLKNSGSANTEPNFGASTISLDPASLPPGSRISLVQLLSEPSTIDAIKYLLSVLPRNNTRLSALRVIAYLSDWPTAREGLFKGDITDALVLISSEAEELHRIKLEDRQANRYSFGELGSAKKISSLVAETATGSSPFSFGSPRQTSETTSETSFGPFSKFRSVDHQAPVTPKLSIQNPNNLVSPSFGIFDKFDGIELGHISVGGHIGDRSVSRSYQDDDDQSPELALEETMLVCYALANFCRAKKQYLERIFDNGLPSIMLQLVKSRNMEIARQALRCVCALCTIIATAPADKVGASRQSKAQLYNDILAALNAALSSDISPMQKEAIVGIANLAPDESLHYDIINNPFKKVISFLLDHHADPDTRAAAENVLLNIGFSGGILDLELCSYDPDVMSDWFYIRKSLKCQIIGRQLLVDWLNVLFGVEVEKDSVQSPGTIIRQTSGSLNGFYDHEFVSGIGSATGAGTTGNMSMHLESSVNTNSSSELNRSSLTSSTVSSWAAGIRNLSMPMVQKRLTDKLSRLLPFCLGRHAAADILADEELAEADERLVSNANNDTVTAEVYVPSIFPPSLKRRYVGSLGDNFPGCDYYGILKPASTISRRGEEIYTGMDSPPKLVQDILDLMYPSKLQQLCCCDLTSLRPEIVISRLPIITKNTDIRLGESSLISLPKPVNVVGFYFPPCSYPFNRVKRVLEQKFERARGDGIKFALAFRDDSFASAGIQDFYGSLMQCLCRCPDVISLSFSCHGIVNGAHISPSLPHDSAFLGHLAGNVPQSIRFINFRGTLSTSSLQAFCILIMKQNSAFVHQGVSESPTSTMPSNNPPLEAIHESGVLWRCRSKGLIGIAITHTILTPVDLSCIIELLTMYLHPYPKKISRGQSENGSVSSAPLSVDAEDSTSSVSDTQKRNADISRIPLFEDVDPRGIRYLDLSSNRLTDAACSEILEAAVCGPLEALELGDNYIHKGQNLLDSFVRCVASVSYSFLKHLGLSGNMLTGKFMCSLLDCLQQNQTLTSLDLSNNDFQHSTLSQTALRSFLRKNKGLRNLNLSFNKLTAESTQSIYLGLLQNETLLLMSLAHNTGAANASEFGLVQEKLQDNRRRYKQCLFNYKKAILAYNISANSTPSLNSDGNGPVVPSVARSNINSTSTKISGGKEDIKRQQTEEINRPDSPVSDSNISLHTPLAVAVPVDSHMTIDLPQANAERSIAPIARAAPESTAIDEVPRLEELHRQLRSDPGSPVAGGMTVQPRPTNNTLTVFFSAPLAWRDRANRLHPLEILDYANERDAIVQVLREVNRDISVVFEFATTDTLRTALSFGCKALHFSGHGHPQCLNFEDGRAGLQLVSVDSLRNLLRAGGLKLDFVFVSACHSRKTGEAFIEAGVPHVVCVRVKDQIEDSTAHAFTRAFYLNLFSGRTVQQSFDIAREALKASPYVQHGIIEGEKFILLPESQSLTHHKHPVFHSAPCAQWPSKPYHMVMGSHRSVYDEGPSRGLGVNSIALHIPGCNSYFYGSGNKCLPVGTPDFEGREVDMYRVITTLLARKQVTITGDNGVGKSSLTAAICSYIADRGLFPDGVVFVRAQALQSYGRLLVAIVKAMMMGPPAVIVQLRKMTNSPGKLTSEVLNDNMDNLNAISELEQLIILVMSTLKILLVIDHIDGLLSEQSSAPNDLKAFFIRLFDRCKYLKLLLTSTTSLSARNITNFGAVENSVALGPLTLRSSIRLFARLAPSLLTSAAKAAFIAALVPLKNAHVTATSRDLTVPTSQILSMFGSGHPSLIVKLACESTQESVQELIDKGIRILETVNSSGTPPLTSSPSAGGDTDTPLSTSISTSTPSSATTPSTSPQVTPIVRSISHNLQLGLHSGSGHFTSNSSHGIAMISGPVGLNTTGLSASSSSTTVPVPYVRASSYSGPGSVGLDAAVTFPTETENNASGPGILFPLSGPPASQLMLLNPAHIGQTIPSESTNDELDGSNNSAV